MWALLDQIRKNRSTKNTWNTIVTSPAPQSVQSTTGTLNPADYSPDKLNEFSQQEYNRQVESSMPKRWPLLTWQANIDYEKKLNDWKNTYTPQLWDEMSWQWQIDIPSVNPSVPDTYDQKTQKMFENVDSETLKKIVAENQDIDRRRAEKENIRKYSDNVIVETWQAYMQTLWSLWESLWWILQMGWNALWIEKDWYSFADSLIYWWKITSQNYQYKYNPDLVSVLDLPPQRFIATVLWNSLATAPLIVPWIVASEWAGAVAGAVWLWVKWVTLAQWIWWGVVSNLFWNALPEMWSSYRNAKDKWLSDEQASEIAKWVFVDNTKLMATDAIQILWLTRRLPKVGWVWRLWTISITEWLEELLQWYWQDNNENIVTAGKEIDPLEYSKQSKAINDFILWSAWWLAMWWVTETYWAIKDTIDSQRDYIKELAKKWDDVRFYDAVKYSLLTWITTKEQAKVMSNYYEILKEKAQPIVEKIAEKTWAKTNLMWWEWAIKAPLSNLEKAQNMETKGLTQNEIWQKTWWEKAENWDWKFEIDDSKAEVTIPTWENKIDIDTYIQSKLDKEEARISKEKWFTTQEEAGNYFSWEQALVNSLYTKYRNEYLNFYEKKNDTLGSVLKHDELYKQYPELKDMPVIFWNEGGAYFSPEFNEIRIDNYYKNTPKEEIISVLLHEIQHAIQLKEMFSWWWSPNNVRGIVQNLIDKLDWLKTTDINKYNEIKPKLDDLKDKNRYTEDDFKLYWKLAWEVESRNVQNRYWKKDNKIIRPWLTEDTPRSEQINLRSVWKNALVTEKPKVEFKEDPKEKWKPLKITQTIKKTAKQIHSLANRWDIKGLTNLIKEKWTDILLKWVDYAEASNMITKEDAKTLRETINEKQDIQTITPRGNLSSQQRISLLDMLWFDKIFKKISDQKILVPQLIKSLKNISAKLFLVQAPSQWRVKLPFALMWNKSATYNAVILPMVKQGASQWVEVYIEPYGWAGTSYYFADEIFNSWIKEMNINHFDTEKFTVVEAIKNWKIVNIEKEVESAYNEVVDEIAEKLQEIPEVKEVMGESWYTVWEPWFTEMAEILFYPQYAKQFFIENPDSKIAFKWNLTEPFKNWLKTKIDLKAKEQGLELTDIQLEEQLEEILSDTSLFEKSYPKMAKDIVEIINKIDDTKIKDWDYTTALKVSVAKHFRQRWDSYQKVISAQSWFNNLIGIKNKMIQWLTKYQQVFDKYWDKINIYHMDWKDFIKEMWKDKNSQKSITYMDPPYIRTTKTYLKNTKDEATIQSLQDYADTSKIDTIFEPMKDSKMIFTNDIDWKYFEALNRLLWDRLNKDIIWYREWTTPTSLVTSTELQISPKKLWLSNYDILKNKFVSDIKKALEESYLPKIAQQQAKHWAKVERAFIQKFTEKFWDLTKIQDEQFRAEEILADLNNFIKDITNGREKVRLLSKVRQLARSNKVRWKAVVDIITSIQKFIKQRNDLINTIRKKQNTIKNSNTIAVEVRDEFIDYINTENLEFKRTSNDIEDKASIINAMKKSEIENPTQEEIALYNEYLKSQEDNENLELDDKEIKSSFAYKIDKVWEKKSIYNMDIDQLQEISNKLDYYSDLWKEMMKARLEGQRVEMEPLIEEAKVSAIKMESTEITGLKDKDFNDLTSNEKAIYWTKEFFQELRNKFKKYWIKVIPSLFVFENELNIYKPIYKIYKKALAEWTLYHSSVADEFVQLEQKLWLTEENYKKIGVYWLANRWDWKGFIKLYTLIQQDSKNPITKRYVDPENKQDIIDVINSFKQDDFLNENEKIMLEFMRKEFTDLWKRINITALETENILLDFMENYFPIKMNAEKNLDTEIDPDIWAVMSSWFNKKNIEHGFIKKATGKKIVPTIDARFVFLSHIYNAWYYAYMQKPLYQLADLKNSLWEAKLWMEGFKYFWDWINMMAKIWKLWTKSFVWKLTRLWSKWAVALNPKSYLIQLTANLEAKLQWVEIFKMQMQRFNKNYKEVVNKSISLKGREFKHAFWWDSAIVNKYEKIYDMALSVISIIDKATAWKIFYNLYTQYKRLWMSEENAIYYADIGMEKTMANPNFDWKSMFQLENERWTWAMLTSFATFTNNTFANFIYGWWLSKEMLDNAKQWLPIPIKLSVKARLKWMTIYFIIMWLMAWLINDELTKLNQAIFNQKPFPETTNMKILLETLSKIPVLWQIVWMAKYDSALWAKWFKNAYDGFDNMNKAKTEDAKNRNFRKMLFSIAEAFGFPTAFQKLYKWYIEWWSTSTKTSTKLKSSKLKSSKLKSNKLK